MYTRDSTIVTNTYPVFKKSMRDNEKGVYLSKTLSEIKKDNYTSTKKYMDEFNLALNNFVRDCYDSAREYYRNSDSSSNENIRLFKIDDGYYLYILQSKPYTILLNYEKVDNNTETINKIPMISNYEIHVREHEQVDKVFKVINTYNAFLNYTSMNGINQNLDANDLFFNCFFDSIKDVDLSKIYGHARRTINVNHQKKIGNEYHYFYYVVEEDDQSDIVIILDYYSYSLKLKND